MGVRGSRGNAADCPEGRTVAADDRGQMRWTIQFGSGVVGVRGSRGDEVEVPEEWTGALNYVVKKC